MRGALDGSFRVFGKNLDIGWNGIFRIKAIEHLRIGISKFIPEFPRRLEIPRDCLGRHSYLDLLLGDELNLSITKRKCEAAHQDSLSILARQVFSQPQRFLGFPVACQPRLERVKGEEGAVCFEFTGSRGNLQA